MTPEHNLGTPFGDSAVITTILHPQSVSAVKYSEPRISIDRSFMESTYSSRPPPDMANSEMFMFTGSPTEDVTLLLNHVQRAAFGQGRQRDDAWCADYASTCLSGNAMRLYAELDAGDRDSWTKLRLVLLERFPQSIVPDPPAAIPAASINSKSSNSVPLLVIAS